MLSAPAIILSAAVTLLAVLIGIWTAILVARTRRRVKIRAPAMGGAPELDCALRVQGNTVEQMLAFLPALWVATLYFRGWAPAIFGLVWCLGRVIFAFAYKPDNPANRFTGFALTIFSTLALVLLGVIGLLNAWRVAMAG